MNLGWLRKIWIWSAFLITVVPLVAYGEEKSDPTEDGYKALQAGNWEKALNEFNEAIRAEPKNSDAYKGRGLAYWKLGKQDSAQLDLNKAIELNPIEATAFRTRGALYVEKGDWDHAIADCDESIRLFSKDAFTYNNRGYAYLCKGNTEKAISDFSEALRLNPSFIHAYMNRGRARQALLEFDQSIEDMDKVLDIDPQNAGALLIRGLSFAGQGDLDKGLADLDQAIQVNPFFSEAYKQRGSMRLSKGKFDQAIADFSEIIRLNPENPDAYLYRGSCFSQKERYVEACNDFDKAIELKPDSPCPYEARGALWIERGKIERGITDIQTAIRLNPTDFAANFENWPKKLLTVEDLQYGEREVRKMLQTRPAMGRYEENAITLYQWATRKFAGEDLRQRIKWDALELPPNRTAENWALQGQSEGYIRVSGKYPDGPRKGQERSFEELWRDVVFECYNIANVKEYSRLKREAVEGKLSKQEYVIKIMECEFLAAEKTRAFYICVFLKWGKEHDVATHPDCWFLAKQTTPNENFILREVCKNMPYWLYYECQYDLIILSSLVDKGEISKAIELADKMYKQLDTNEVRATISLQKGYCLVKLNQPMQAIDALNEYITYNPGHVNAYLTRAAAFAILHKMDSVIADYDKAIQLDPSNYDAYRLRGSAYEEMGEIERAESDISRAKLLLEQKENK